MTFEKPAYLVLTYFLALIPALAFIYAKRRGKKTRMSVILRAFFNPKIWLSRSSLVDFGYLVLGVAVFPSLLFYTTVSGAWIGEQVNRALSHGLGARPALPSQSLYIGASAATIYVAYEFAYWLNHYLSHKIRFLWEFHRVHHAATVLTPVTVWRVHLGDTLLFANMTITAVGLSQGCVSYWFGHDISIAASGGANLLLYGFMSAYGHLQHSQIWIPFTGAAGRVFFSPAHHQIHHSTNPKHYNTNFGSSLAVFDWMFGTLCLPGKENEKLSYGVDNDAYIRTFVGSNLYPFLFAWKRLTAQLERRRRNAVCRKWVISG